ncbi:MAG: heat-inducible transcriptional repressor HrcA, partial [bacterium]
TPVGSRFLSKRYDLGISSATIRNTMNDLEDMGYLCQPHISAGRLPTDLGYRFHVDSLMAIPRLRKVERELITDSIDLSSKDEDDIFEVSSRVLSKISSQLGVVLEPSFEKGVFQKMEFVSVSGKRLLAVITIKSGLVKTVMIETDSEVDDKLLSETCQTINNCLFGLTLDEVVESIGVRLSDSSSKANFLLQTIVESSNKLFNFKDQENLYFGGTNYIMTNPEFTDRECTLKILNMLENKETVLHHFEKIHDENVSVRIGEENRQEMFLDYSIISAKYHLGNISGILGVVGPTRMHYAKIIAIVDFMRNFLTSALGGEPGSQRD